MRKTFILALSIVAFSVAVNAQTRRPTRPVVKKTTVSKAPAVLSAGAVKTPSGLIYLITKTGTGVLPKTGQRVSVHYTGMLTDGTPFDTSRDTGKPIEFALGTGRVIKGWDEGIAKMHVGDQAIFVIPSSIGYGPEGNGPIPPNAALVFVVELVGVRD